MADVSKNQTRGQRKQELICGNCGGTIKMFSVATGSKLKQEARCMGDCGAVARRPRDLMAE